MLDPVIVEFMQMDHKNTHLTYDWTEVFTQPMHARVSLIDRSLTTLGDVLIRVGSKLKQHSRSQLTTEQTQAPTFLIML